MIKHYKLFNITIDKQLRHTFFYIESTMYYTTTLQSFKLRLKYSKWLNNTNNM